VLAKLWPVDIHALLTLAAVERFMPIRSWIATFGSSRPLDLEDKSNPRSGLLLVGFLFWWSLLWVAWAVRLWHLDASDLTFDEAATYFVANRPLLDILAYLRGAVREHPPLYYLLIHAWMGLAGSSEYSLRFFAAGASMVGIALTARLARSVARQLRLTHLIETFLAVSTPALIMALFPFEVYYARDARMYTLTVVWATLSSLLFLALIRDPQREGWPSLARLAALVLINCLAVFTHFYLVLLVITQFFVLLVLRQWRAVVAWSVGHGLVFLVGLVWLLRAPGLVASLEEAWGRFVPVWPTVGQLRRLVADLLFGPIRGVPWRLVYGWGALVALGLAALWIRAARGRNAEERRGAQKVGVWLTVTLLLPIALAYFMPEPPRSRYLIYLLPFAALLVGQIPTLFAGQKTVALTGLGLSALVVLSLGVFGLPRTVKWIKSDYGRTVETIVAHSRSGDGVLFHGPWQALQFHYYRPESFPPITALPPQAPPQLQPEEAEPVLRDLLNSYQRLWVIPASVEDVDPGHFVTGWLDTNAHPVWTSHDLSLYMAPAAHEAVSLPSELAFGDRLQLERVASDARAVPAGESLRLTLTWAVSQTLDSDVKLDLTLVDERGNRWLQWQRVPGRWRNPPSAWESGDLITDREGVVLPQGAPPGTYTIQLTVLDGHSGMPLPPADAGGRLPQAKADLLTFEVVEPVSPPVLAEAGDFRGPFDFESPPGTETALTLAGYDLGGLKFTQGNPVPLRLHWLAPDASLAGLTLRLQLQPGSLDGTRGGGAPSEGVVTLPLVAGYPVSQWRAGRLVSNPIALVIPADAPPGPAELALSVHGPDDQPWKYDGKEWLTLASLTIEERAIEKKLPAGLERVEVDYADAVSDTGDEIGLRGYRVEGAAQPGGRLELTYGWHALSHPTRIYSVFNHLLTADGQKIAQADGWPQDGMVLTNQWQPGEYVQDSHAIDIPSDAPPGPYILAVGLYDAASGERLSAFLDGEPLPGDQWQLRIGTEHGEQP
jgi:mannosyltransferase